MKISNILRLALFSTALALTACRSHKDVVKDSTSVVFNPIQDELLSRVDKQAQRGTVFVGSKLKFSVSMGSKKMSLSGNLRMKRDDVIRLQLMALGLVEAARMEFTKDYVLFIDRINKQYLKAPYADIEFMRNSGINFNTLQALFWNELFQPGKDKLTNEDMKRFTTSGLDKDEAIINFEEHDDGLKSKMYYSWIVSNQTGRIKLTNIQHRVQKHGNTQLNWEYRDYKKLGSKLFPCDMGVTLTTPKKEVKLDVKLSSLNNDDDWDARTRVSSRYREVDFDEIMERIMAL
ncbi:MAG: DUF4292 domain-containing protein [Prevotella sp.]|nr:DUF4292 domain-containing protein [Prevotella sp.]